MQFKPYANYLLDMGARLFKFLLLCAIVIPLLVIVKTKINYRNNFNI